VRPRNWEGRTCWALFVLQLVGAIWFGAYAPEVIPLLAVCVASTFMAAMASEAAR
jgi:hypothetical protein